MYQVNPASFGSVFVLPSDVVDKHLRLAGSVQLKVLLWFYRHAADVVDFDELVNFIGLPRSDVYDALQYWLDCGLIVESGKVTLPTPAVKAEQAADEKKTEEEKQAVSEKEKPAQQKEQEAEKKKTEKLPDIPLIKPTMEQLALRLEESDELCSLFLEAQNILGRTIGFDAQSSLLMLHDHYGLPPSVILMICEYARSQNKQNSMSYILKIGKDWAEREIDSFEKASEQLERLEVSNSTWNKFKIMAGIATPRPTMKQQSYLSVWVSDWTFSIDMIYAAYEEMAEKTGGLSFSYINKVLQSWHGAGVKTPDELEAYREERSASFKKPSAKTGKKTGTAKAGGGAGQNKKSSYDLDEAERKANFESLIYKKKGGK